MLYLLFQLGKERYALEAGQALEVIPYVTLKRIPRAPTGVAGVINYRGRPLPAVDLCLLTFGRPARELWSTRIIVVKISGPQSHRPPSAVHDPQSAPRTEDPELGTQNSELGTRAIGLIVEHATGMIRREPGQFVSAGVELRNAPYLGPVIMDEQGVIQRLHPEHLLSEQVRQLLSSEFRVSSSLSHETD
jgi:chemotaxis-related protein WspB